MSKRKWLAVYTKPRWEKKVDQILKDKGIESYCPLNKVHRKWSDRMKMVEEPLFKSYVFVHIDEEEEKVVRFVSGVLNFVYWLGKPAVIKPKDIERIKKFLNEHNEVSVEMMTLRPDDTVIIRSGLLMDKTAKVLRNYGKKVMVEIESLGYKLVAYVDNKQVEVVRK